MRDSTAPLAARPAPRPPLRHFEVWLQEHDEGGRYRMVCDVDAADHADALRYALRYRIADHGVAAASVAADADRVEVARWDGTPSWTLAAYEHLHGEPIDPNPFRAAQAADQKRETR